MKKDASCRDLRIEAGDHGKDRSRSSCPSGILIAYSNLGNLAVATESRKSTLTPPHRFLVSKRDAKIW